MSKISKFPLRPGVRKKLIKNLWKVITKLKTAQKAESFWGNVFTPAEQEMLAKRLEALKLLAQKKTYAEIGKTINMSSVTLSRLNNRLREDENLQKKVEKLI